MTFVFDGYFGKWKYDIKKLSDGSILAEVNSESQSISAFKLTQFGPFLVTITSHPILNIIKGVITCKHLTNCTDEEILENLKVKVS